MGNIKSLCLLVTPPVGLLIPYIFRSSEDFIQPMAATWNSQKLKWCPPSSSCVGSLTCLHFLGSLLDHPALAPTTMTDLHEEKKIKPFFLSSFFLEVVCFSCTVKCLLQGHYIFAEQKKDLLWGWMKEHI